MMNEGALMFRITLFFFISLRLFADSDLIVQDKVGRNTCGACALVHSLTKAKNISALNKLEGQNSIEKAKGFIKRLDSLTSPVYNNLKPIYQPNSGIADIDLLIQINKLLIEASKPEVKGKFIQRAEESPKDFVKQTHKTLTDSIKNGFHPLLSIRAMAAEYSEKNKKFLWNSKGGHWVAVHKIGPLSKLGFTITFSDSLTGEMKEGYINAELHRGAAVPMNFTVDEQGKEQWEWVSNEKTLQLTSPEMPLGTKRAKWHERTFIAIRYLIYR